MRPTIRVFSAVFPVLVAFSLATASCSDDVNTSDSATTVAQPSTTRGSSNSLGTTLDTSAGPTTAATAGTSAGTSAGTTAGTSLSTSTSEGMTTIDATSDTADSTGPMETTSVEPGLPTGGEPARKVVFISATLYMGDLGGLAGADSECQSAAESIGLQGTYRAWLSDSTGSPSTRFAQADVPYVLLDGSVVADDWSDLTDGTLNVAINLNELLGASSGNVFTNTTPSGTVWDETDCTDWTDSAGSIPGNGFPPNADATWTQGGKGSNCFDTLHIYCFEQ